MNHPPAPPSPPSLRMPIDLLKHQAARTGTFLGALIKTSPFVPLVAVLLSIATYVATGAFTSLGGLRIFLPLLFGVVVTILLWLLSACLVRRTTAVDQANMESYGTLLTHLTELEARLESLAPGYQESRWDRLTAAKGSRDKTPPFTASPLSLPPLPPMQKTSLEEAIYHCNSLYTMLCERNLAWVMAMGYVDLWNAENRAEEALLDVEPVPYVIAEALTDYRSLTDSRISQQRRWLTTLSCAAKGLGPEAEKYFRGDGGASPANRTPYSGSPEASTKMSTDPPVSSPLASSEGSATPSPERSGAASDTSQGETSAGHMSEEESQARTILRTVRGMLNSYQRKNIAELIRARNRLRTLTVLAGVAVFILVELGLITALAAPRVGIDEKAIVMSTFYFLIGAGAGLFGRLYSEAKVSKAVNDYHLTLARFELTPLLSGSAAVIAVIVNQQLNLFGSNTSILGNLVIAILFGLVPNQLINLLQNKASEVAQNLQSVQPTEGKQAREQTRAQEGETP